MLRAGLKVSVRLKFLTYKNSTTISTDKRIAKKITAGFVLTCNPTECKKSGVASY